MTRLIIGAAIGAVLGALTGYFGKCTGGACPLTANPMRGSMYGMFIGIIVSMAFGPGSVGSVDTENIKPLTGGEEFEAKINSRAVVVVDFFSPRCGPCLKLMPVLDEIAGSYAGKADIYKLNVIENNAIAAMHNVSAVPTVIFFHNGKEAGRIIGYKPASRYIETIDELLGEQTGENGQAQAPPNET